MRADKIREHINTLRKISSAVELTVGSDKVCNDPKNYFTAISIIIFCLGTCQCQGTKKSSRVEVYSRCLEFFETRNL